MCRIKNNEYKIQNAQCISSVLIRLYELFQWSRHRPTKAAVHPFRYKSVTPDKHRSWINAASNQQRGFVAWSTWSACQWRYAAKPGRCVSQGEVLEIDKGSEWPLRNIDQHHHHPQALEVGHAALRRLGGWVVLTDVIMNAISTLCTSTEPSCQETRDLVQYPYHISVCDHQDIWRNYAWERHQMYRLQNLYTTDVKKVIPMSSFRSVGSAVVTEGCNLYNDHHSLWSTRGECYKSSLPISLW